MNKHKIFIVCTGLGVIQRGYESFARECFDALKETPAFDFYLYTGKGEKKEKEKAILNLKRDASLAKFIGGILRQSGYYVEQLTYFVFFIPELLLKKPAIVLTSDFYLACWLHHLKKITGLKYRLVFSNGAPNGPPFHFADTIHQLSQYQYNIALAGGEDPRKHVVVPYGIRLNEILMLPDREERIKLRGELELPRYKTILISVGAVKSEHKRMDYLIREFAAWNHPDKFLLILGQMDQHSVHVIQLAKELLKKGEYKITTVDYAIIHRYYQAADMFVLASLHEGFGRVILEAGAHGLYTMVHDNEMFREILGEAGQYGDLSKEGALLNMLDTALPVHAEISQKLKIHKYIYTHFGWKNLREKYLTMFWKVIS